MTRCALLSLLLAVPAAFAAETHRADVIVYGNNSAGVVAAQQVLRMGKTVILVGPDKHLGGLSAGGLGWTDSGNKAVIGGLSRAFYHRIYLAYQQPDAWKWQKQEQYGNKGQGTEAIDGKDRTMWIFEPHVAERVFEDIVRDDKIPLFRDRWLDREKGVRKEGGRITAITMLDGDTFAGSMFIDATYEGDLMAAAGVTYTVGRESNAQYGETMNGVQTKRAHSHQFEQKIDPYVVPGDPKSGLLPRVHDGDPGKDGEGDKRLQAYNFRMCLTQHEPNRVPFPKPDGYDPAQYELLLRTLLAGSKHVFGKFDPIPNLKTDTNNHGSFSTDNIGMNYDYPDASYERRREIIAEHRRYQQGYQYFLANDPRVPEAVRTRYAQWGLAADEFKDNGNWPHQIYVREARRMVSDVVVNENHLTRRIPTPRPVGMGSYNMDSHHTQRYVARDADGKAYVRNEGDIQVNPGGPYPIDYGALVPKKAECENLLVPVCVSCSHIAYGSIRMEPVFMILGQSAATAAVLALNAGQAVQDVPFAALRERLLADGQVLEFTSPERGKPAAEVLKPADGVIVDDAQAELAGDWTEADSIPGFHGAGYRHNGGKSQGLVRFSAKLPKDGRYRVRFWYNPQANRSESVPVAVRHARGEEVVRVNQKLAPVETGIGLFHFSAAQAAVVEVRAAEATPGHVIVDAVQFVPVE
jgi:FAD dependent oxidoreductase